MAISGVPSRADGASSVPRTEKTKFAELGNQLFELKGSFDRPVPDMPPLAPEIPRMIGVDDPP